ncbi:MAG TPA: hypothetical protein VE152_04350 [Acidimicrobiales bacterium]|nr:hypothetical protein [Acidimicrobiales bacterium]
MTATATAQVIARAGARAQDDPDFAEVLAALVDTPTAGAGEYAHLAAGELGRHRRRAALAEFKAGALATSEVQDLLGLGTPQAVHRLRSRARLIGLQLGNATWFPTWQFGEGRLRPDLPRILELLGRFTGDVVAADRVMRLIRPDLEDVSIAAALDRPELAPRAWVMLAELGS